MFVEWRSSNRETWCPLRDVRPDAALGRGVYIIWKPSRHVLHPATVVRVGGGNVLDSLLHEKTNPVIQAHGDDLLCSWAEVDEELLPGVCQYLTHLLRPIEPALLSTVASVPVNLPLAAG